MMVMGLELCLKVLEIKELECILLFVLIYNYIYLYFLPPIDDSKLMLLFLANLHSTVYEIKYFKLLDQINDVE